MTICFKICSTESTEYLKNSFTIYSCTSCTHSDPNYDIHRNSYCDPNLGAHHHMTKVAVVGTAIEIINEHDYRYVRAILLNG
mmetsp:Transcript_29794/g.40911  ORF Transcript_29794/g.40911 Transcript_29794/m.40911 type:complete len:82 (-) Transcript_29794:811-1056(-)